MELAESAVAEQAAYMIEVVQCQCCLPLTVIMSIRVGEGVWGGEVGKVRASGGMGEVSEWMR